MRGACPVEVGWTVSRKIFSKSEAVRRRRAGAGGACNPHPEHDLRRFEGLEGGLGAVRGPDYQSCGEKNACNSRLGP